MVLNTFLIDAKRIPTAKLKTGQILALLIISLIGGLLRVQTSSKIPDKPTMSPFSSSSRGKEEQT